MPCKFKINKDVLLSDFTYIKPKHDKEADDTSYETFATGLPIIRKRMKSK